MVGAALDELRGIPLFVGVDERWLRWVGSIARRRSVAAGATVLRQWDVLSQGRLLTSMTAGDFFGELAALDWGAGFGYPRLAAVRARTDLLLLVLTDAELAELMSSAPQVDSRVRAAAAQRAARL